MVKPEQLLKRLDEIGAALQRTGQALALLGLGSVGTETDRLDDYSDLDFFAIVKPGYKRRFIDQLDWLEAVHPVAFAFQNTDDGYKLLYADGIFCEYAVFEPDELARIPFASGRIVWREADFDPAFAVPAPAPTYSHHTTVWRLGEALTNLYVGLGRYHRGEKLSAARFIQQYAVDQVLKLSAEIESEQPAHVDQFNVERRYEQRFPQTAALLPQFVQGYDHSIESALALLAWLDAHFDVNPAIKAAIMELCR